MSGSAIFGAGIGALILSFGIPMFSIPLQSVSLLLFILAEIQFRHEIHYVTPLKEERRKAWQKSARRAIKYAAAAGQVSDQNQIDWHYRQANLRRDLRGSVQEKYLRLFTQGHLAQQQQLQAAAPTGDKAQSAAAPTDQDKSQAAKPEAPGGGDLLQLENLRNAAFILIWGCPGGGKTSLAKRIAQLRAEAGDRIVVADPHGSKAAWEGWQIIGAGRNYEALDEYLEEYDQRITSEYKRYSNGETSFTRETIIGEEFTQWADNCKNSARFIKSICSDIRKVGKQAIIVSHADTLTGLGNAQGMMAAINRAAIKIELEANINQNGDYVATGYGWIQYPGKDRNKVRISNV